MNHLGLLYILACADSIGYSFINICTYNFTPPQPLGHLEYSIGNHKGSF